MGIHDIITLVFPYPPPTLRQPPLITQPLISSITPTTLATYKPHTIIMSGPYDQYNQGYQQYPPQGQYPPQQQGWEQGGYQQQGYPPQQQGQGYYDQQQQGYGQQQQYPPQGQYPGQAPAQQFPQQGAYAQDQYPHGQNAYGQPQQGQYGATDPNMQAEG